MTRSAFAPFFALAALAACSSSGSNPSTPTTPPPGDGPPVVVTPEALKVPQARSEKPRETKPNVAPGDLDTLTGDERTFATKLFAQLAKNQPGENVFFSPHSIYTAFGMLYAGAQGSTESAMASGLEYSLPQARLHAAMNALDLALESRATGAAGTGADGKGFRLAIANSVWSQKGFAFETPYLDTLAVNYGAGLNLVDFLGDGEGASKQINAWIEAKTEGRIKDLVKGLPSQTKVVLANAVYFNAAWQDQFTESATVDGMFQCLYGAQPAKLMKTTSYGGYSQTAAYDALSLRYEGGKVEFVAIAPKAGTYDTYESGFDRAAFDAAVAGLKSGQVDVTMPRFEIKGDAVSLKPALSTLGLGEIFADNANFKGVTPAEGFHVFDAVHKAFVKVNEKGTEAAAATAIIAGTTSVGPTPVPITLDRPFLFAIRDVPTGAVLFLGRVVKPAEPAP